MAIVVSRTNRNLIRPNVLFIGGVCFILSSLTGCAAKSASLMPSRKPAPPIHQVGSADRGLSSHVETPVSGERERTPVIVIGFVGGFVRSTDSVHSPVQVAARIRNSYPSGVYVEVFENRRREEAHRKILEILRKARDGKLSEAAKQQARVIIYGMSWGGSETVALARELKEDRIPVLLTVQVDSVAKVGQNDELIPANVAEAANFYQTDGLLHGREQIRAEKEESTRILGNFQYRYKRKSPSCDEYPWYDRLFTKYHTKIECDPEVWSRVEFLIREKLPPAEEKATKQSESQH